MNKKGFTLMELLIVIAILGLLAVVGLTSYKGSIKRARDAQRRGDLFQVRTALRLYYSDAMRYPNDDGAGKINEGCAVVPCAWGSQFGVGSNVYMGELPEDPLDSQSYYYDRVSEDTFTVYACLENTGDPEGEDVPVSVCPSGKRLMMKVY